MKESDEERARDNWIENAPDAELTQKLCDSDLDPDERRRIEEELAHRASWRSMTDEQREAVLGKMRANVDALGNLGAGGVLSSAQAKSFTRRLIE